MITFELWRSHVIDWKYSVTMIDYLWCLIASIITIPLDIILSPLEIIALILWKINDRNK